jgi:hypothetical protein
MSKRKPARTIKARSASKIRSKAAGSGQPTGRANSKQARVSSQLTASSATQSGLRARGYDWRSGGEPLLKAPWPSGGVGRHWREAVSLSATYLIRANPLLTYAQKPRTETEEKACSSERAKEAVR